MLMTVDSTGDAHSEAASIDGVADPVWVPHTELSPDILRAVIESFVLREGTDYGEHEVSLEQKVSAVMHQLARGEAKILFDPATQSVAIVTR